MSKHTILFLAANPRGTDRLALDEEARAIQVELERSGHRDQFDLTTRWAVRPLDLLRELRRLKPTIVHFSGHGGRGELRSAAGVRRDIVDFGGVDPDEQHGLFFQGPDGQPQLVSTEALQEAFGAAGSSVRLVVLNACYSEVQSGALLAHVDCVVGIGGAIRDDTARSFAIGFYGGLGERESVAAAYKQGCAAVSLDGLPESERPRLRIRDGVDGERCVLAAATRIQSARGRDLVFVVGSAIIAGAPVVAWLGVPTHGDPFSPPPVPETTSAASRSPERVWPTPLESSLGAPRAASPDNANRTPCVLQPTATPVKQRNNLRKPAIDCNGGDSTLPMCSYRGTLRWVDGAPIADVNVELVGTGCSTITTKLGIFDFRGCDSQETQRLVNPKIFVDLPQARGEIPLRVPPLMTEVHIDPIECHFEQLLPAVAASSQVRVMLPTPEGSDRPQAGSAEQPSPEPTARAPEPDAVISAGANKLVDDRVIQNKQQADVPKPPLGTAAAVRRPPTPAPAEDSKSITALVKQAEGLEKAQQWDDARAVYQKLEMVKGYNLGEARYHQAWNAFLAGRIDEAMQLAQEARFVPSSFKIPAELLYGDALYRQQLYDRAKTIYVGIRGNFTGNERVAITRKIASCNHHLRLPESDGAFD